MKSTITAAAAALTLALAGCATAPGGGYGYGGGGFGGGTQLSQCMRNALIGAGVGAVAGAVIGSENNRVENAAIGAAVAGGGTFAACRLIEASTQNRIEQAYLTALQTNAPFQTSWTATTGGARGVQVGQPQPAPGAPNCRIINAQLVTTGNPAVRPLPTERYCATPQGWMPA